MDSIGRAARARAYIAEHPGALAKDIPLLLGEKRKDMTRSLNYMTREKILICAVIDGHNTYTVGRELKTSPLTLEQRIAKRRIYQTNYRDRKTGRQARSPGRPLPAMIPGETVEDWIAHGGHIETLAKQWEYPTVSRPKVPAHDGMARSHGGGP